MGFKQGVFGCVVAACCVAVSGVYAQMPTGGIVGVVRDASGGVIQRAKVTARSRATGMVRSSITEESGVYRISVLPAGEYELSAEAEGFRKLVRQIVVLVGSTTTVDLELSVGGLAQSVEATGAASQMSLEKYGVSGVVSRFEIENLPLNGREFLQLSVLEPGVTAAPSAGFFSRQFDVSILGGSPNATRVTMDGGPIYNALNGGVPQNFSQESVIQFSYGVMKARKHLLEKRPSDRPTSGSGREG